MTFYFCIKVHTYWAKFKVSSPNFYQKSWVDTSIRMILGWTILWNFLIYPYKLKYVFIRGLPLFKDAAPELNLG